jgi:hypothetical protein
LSITQEIKNRGMNVKWFAENLNINYKALTVFSSGKGKSFNYSIAHQLFKDGFGEAVRDTFPKRKFTYDTEKEVLTVETQTKRCLMIRKYPQEN